jgi:hypothetical protein
LEEKTYRLKWASNKGGGSSYSQSSIFERDEDFSLYKKLWRHKWPGIELRTIWRGVQYLVPRPIDFLILKCVNYSAKRGLWKQNVEERERNTKQKAAPRGVSQILLFIRYY